MGASQTVVLVRDNNRTWRGSFDSEIPKIDDQAGVGIEGPFSLDWQHGRVIRNGARHILEKKAHLTVTDACFWTRG